MFAFWIFIKVTVRKMFEASFVFVNGHVRGPHIIPAVVSRVPESVRVFSIKT